MGQIRAVLKDAGLPAREVMIDDWGGVQQLVGGYAEYVPLYYRPLFAVVNEDGRRLCMQLNVRYPELGYTVVGPVLVMAVDIRGENMSLTDEQSVVVIEDLNRRAIWMSTTGEAT